MPDSDAPITRELVAAAVQALTAAGRRTSWREVRKHLGKGSPNTILAHLRAIEAETSATLARSEPQPPAAITDLVGTKVWQAALAAAREQAQAEIQDLNARLQAEEARCADLAGLVERLEEQVVEARRQGDAQVEALRALARGQEDARARDQAADAHRQRIEDAIAALAQHTATRHQELVSAIGAGDALLARTGDGLHRALQSQAEEAGRAWAHLGAAGDDRSRRLDALIALHEATARQAADHQAELRAATEQQARRLAEGLDALGRSQAGSDRSLLSLQQRTAALDAALDGLARRLEQDRARQEAGTEALAAALARTQAALDTRDADLDRRLAAAVKAALPPVAAPPGAPS